MSPDVVVVGAGPNRLAAAVTRARAGLKVRVLEGAPAAGGGTRTAELTLPGFLHHDCSAVHPMARPRPSSGGPSGGHFGFRPAMKFQLGGRSDDWRWVRAG